MRQDHVGAEDGGDGAAHAGDVARALDDLLVNLLGHEQSLAFGANPSGMTATRKKAVVKLSADSKNIEIFEGMV